MRSFMLDMCIQERVRFHNTGSSSIPGVIVMSLEDGHDGVPGITQLDPMLVIHKCLSTKYMH